MAAAPSVVNVKIPERHGPSHSSLRMADMMVLRPALPMAGCTVVIAIVQAFKIVDRRIR